jgi:polyhydroxyalkanoate synthesis repressor PhaR
MKDPYTFIKKDFLQKKEEKTIRVIKKYSNRRLYDTQISSYITLESIKQLILQNEDFYVVQVTTGNDITQLTLMQLMLEEESKGSPILTTTIIKELIRAYGGLMQSMMSRFLEHSIQAFIAQQASLKSPLNVLRNKNNPSLINDIAKNNMNHFEERIKSPS